MRLLFIALLLVASATVMPVQSRPDPQLVKQLQTTQHDSTRLRLCLTIAQYYYSKTQYDSLYPYVQRGLNLLSKSSSHAYAAELNFLISRYYRYKGQYRKGIPYGKLAVEQALKNHTFKRAAELQYYLAVLYSDARDGSKAVDQIGANLRYLQQHDDGPTRAANYVLMINLFEELNNTAMQKLYWQKYVALDKRSWPAEDKMLAYGNIGELLEREGKLKQAEVQLRKALYYASLTSAPAIPVSKSLEYLGTNLRKQGKYQPAIKVFQEAFSIAKLIKNVPQMSSIKRELALTYLAFRNLGQALLEAQYSLSIARQYKERYLIIDALNSLGSILEAQGHYQQALQFSREEQQLREQQFTEVNGQKIAQMQAQFEAETKENTIKLLQKGAQINQLNALRQQEQLSLARRTQVGGCLFIVVLLIVVGLTIYNLRKSRRNNALLLTQQVLIQQTASQLVESNTVKDKLFSLIAHDLRSPLASIKTNIQQILESHQRPEQFPTLIMRLDKQVDNVLGLLTNLLDWSMIQLKGFHPQLRSICLHDMIEDISSQASEPIRQKDLTLINRVDPSVMVLADKHQLQAVVRNILGNAIKFTPMGGYIGLLAKKHGEFVELQIKDSGIGMTTEQLSRLFSSPEVRGGTMGEKGVGLGLQICKEMLERQGGRLLIESQPGKGTTVRIKFMALSEEYQLQSITNESIKEAT
jgi:signal transduction histidine kinase